MRLFKHKNGYWYVEISRNDKKSLKTKNKALAQDLFKEIQRERILGRFVRVKKKIRLSQFIKEYLEDRKGKKSDNTNRIDRQSFNKFQEFIGDPYLETITRKQADNFVSYMGKDFKPVTINITIRSIKAAFTKAIEWEYIHASPFEYVKQLTIKDDLPRAILPEEIKKLMDVIDNREFKEYLLTCLYTGGRRTESAMIRWEDLEKDNGSYNINMRITKTKVRKIPLAENLREILFKRKRKEGPVFPYYYKHPKQASKHFRKYADMVGLERVKLHDTKHTAGTYMIMQGVPLRLVQQILGHSSVKTTEKYTKLITGQLREAINRISY